MPKTSFKIQLTNKWKERLLQHVSFYNKLTEEQKLSFEVRVLDFLDETKITAVSCNADELDYLLIASSAIIPVFKFPNWKYNNLNEVFLYPKPFDKRFNITNDAKIKGMVGTGFMEGKMILSKTSLRQGFQAEKDKQNVGIHEFIHLIDGADGKIDGIPESLIAKQYVLPWIDMVYKKIEEIKTQKSDIRMYGATNEQEFLAVVSEYFFEHPTQLKKKHPELYNMLSFFFKEKE